MARHAGHRFRHAEQRGGDRYRARDQRPHHDIVASVSGCDRHGCLRIPQGRASARRAVRTRDGRSPAASRRLHPVPGRAGHHRVPDRHLRSPRPADRRQHLGPGPAGAGRLHQRRGRDGRGLLESARLPAAAERPGDPVAEPLHHCHAGGPDGCGSRARSGEHHPRHDDAFLPALRADVEHPGRQRRRDRRDRHRRGGQPANDDHDSSAPLVRARAHRRERVHARRSDAHDQEHDHRRERVLVRCRHRAEPSAPGCQRRDGRRRGRPVRGRSEQRRRREARRQHRRAALRIRQRQPPAARDSRDDRPDPRRDQRLQRARATRPADCGDGGRREGRAAD